MLNVKNNIYKKFTKRYKAPSFKMRLYKRKQKKTRKFCEFLILLTLLIS